jgi:hypothetical protein
MKIMWLSYLLTMNVPDEDYVVFLSVDYERTWWRLCGFPLCWLWTYLMKIMWLSSLLTINVPDEDYVAFLSVDYERTWWGLCGFPIC